MTHAQLAGRLRGIAARKPTDIWRELHALAAELEQTPGPVTDLTAPVSDDDMEALIRVTQPSTARRSRLQLLLPWGPR